MQEYDDAAVRARYAVPADRYADFAALRGDPSDGLPGVAGIGEKTAARLIERYGSLTGIISAMDDPGSALAPGIRRKLLAARDYLAVALQVVRVARDIPVAQPITGLTAPADPDGLLALARQWNLVGSCRRLVDAITGTRRGDRPDQAVA